jgi:hypothetical protein
MKKTITTIYIIAIALTMITFTSCEKEVFGCTDPSSTNYDPYATDDNGTCEYNGNVTFWYNSVGTDATVTIGGQTFFITGYYPTYNPTCGSDKCANFTLEVGTYSYHASSTWSTWNGNIAVTKNGCSLVLLH